MGYHHNILHSDNEDFKKIEKQIDCRQFLTKTSLGLGASALGSLMAERDLFGKELPIVFEKGNV